MTAQGDNGWQQTPSDVPDVLGPELDCVFCGINPGRVSAVAAAHFANPRNDFWRLLHDAGFTPRALAAAEQFELLRRRNRPQREAGLVQQPPEVVARVREVRLRRGRDPARIDPAEEHP